MSNGTYKPATQFEQYVVDQFGSVREDIREIKARDCCKHFPEVKVKTDSMWKWSMSALGGGGLLGAIAGWFSGSS